MMGWITGGADLLLQAARALPDTIFTKQVAAEPALFEKITSAASGIMTITIIILSAALIPAAWNFRKSYKKVSDMLDKIYGDINPLMRHASAIADNVDYISTAIRVDIQQGHAAVFCDPVEFLEPDIGMALGEEEKKG